jgi:uncharacterized membrane protein
MTRSNVSFVIGIVSWGLLIILLFVNFSDYSMPFIRNIPISITYTRLIIFAVTLIFSVISLVRVIMELRDFRKGARSKAILFRNLITNVSFLCLYFIVFVHYLRIAVDAILSV